MPIKYTSKELYFEYDNFTPFDDDTCGVFFLSSNTVMLCIALLTHYGKWRNRYSHDLNKPLPDNITDSEFKEIVRIVDRAIGELMADCEIKQISHSMREIEYTLKHLLNKLTDETEIKFFIEKPAEPPIDATTGEWDLTVNNTISSPGMSVFTVGSLLENNSITDVLKIATLDDGTIQFPDINPFNLESKLDQIRADITEAKDTHYWFAKAFYGGPLADLYPFGEQTFFARFSGTFNKEIPLTGYISESFYTLASKLNVNIVTSFNETNTDGVASNSYFRYLHIWLNSDWKLFHDVMETMRDCICEAKDWIEQINIALWGDDSTPQLQFIKNSIDNATTAVEGLTLSTTVNVSPTPINNTVNVDACCDGLVDATKDIANNGKDLVDVIKDLVDATKDNGSTTKDNGDGTYTTTPNVTVTVNPIINVDLGEDGVDTTTVHDPLDENYTENGYYKILLKRSNSHDAKCGYVYKTMNDIADSLDSFIDFVVPIAQILTAMGFTIADFVSYVTTFASIVSSLINPATIPVAAGVNLVKAAGVKGAKELVELGVKVVLIDGVGDIGHAIADAIRLKADDMACAELNNVSQASIMGYVSSTMTGSSPFTAIVLRLTQIILDYTNASDTVANIVDMRSYAQYCPCPLIADWTGVWRTPYLKISIQMVSEYTFEGQRENWSEGWPASGSKYFYTVIGTINPENILSATSVVTGYKHLYADGTEAPNHHSVDYPNYTLINGSTQLNENGTILDIT